MLVSPVHLNRLKSTLSLPAAIPGHCAFGATHQTRQCGGGGGGGAGGLNNHAASRLPLQTISLYIYNIHTAIM